MSERDKEVSFLKYCKYEISQVSGKQKGIALWVSKKVSVSFSFGDHIFKRVQAFKKIKNKKLDKLKKISTFAVPTKTGTPADGCQESE